MSAPLAAVTVMTANYLPYARTLFASVRRHHPDARCLALLVDRVNGRFAPEKETFEIVPVEEASVPDLRQMLFKYTPWERVMAFKPVALRLAFDRYPEAERFLYLDSDCWVTGALDTALEALGGQNILLTPHFLQPVPDERKINELLFLRIGLFNMGFLGLRRGETSKRFVKWWEEKLRWGCFANALTGFFVDQKWMDLVPGLFDGVEVFRDPGYNVAVWNALDRPIAKDGEGYRAGGAPLAVFHFTGFDPHGAGEISRVPPEGLARGQLPEGLRELIDRYAQALLENGYDACMGWKGAFDFFDDGQAIPKLWPIYYHDVLRFRMKEGHDPYKGLPFSPVLGFLRHWPCPERHLRDRPYYFALLTLMQKLGYVPKMLWGPPA